jgi:predicted 3-demethylubiquinone-9 3-methyltransferase (glyoxalase superfamily)
MNTIIDQNELVKKFDFSSIITEDDRWQAMFIIKDIIDSGNYFTNSPPFQTKENLFGRDEAIWLKFRMSFLMSVFMYLGHEAKVSNMMAWSFMTNTDTQENRDTYWHHHNKHSGQSLSGIMYLHIPPDVQDFDTCGTEMAPNGPEGDGKFFIRPSYGTWQIYPSATWHRPGIAQSKDYRFIIAADVDIS